MSLPSLGARGGAAWPALCQVCVCGVGRPRRALLQESVSANLFTQVHNSFEGVLTARP